MLVQPSKSLAKRIPSPESTSYRRAAAVINYMALDRGDLGFASNDVSRGLAKPTMGDVIRLNRVLRYIRGKPRVYYEF